MTDPIIELVPGVRASLIPGPFPAANVRWVGGYLCVGVAPTHPDSSKQERGTTGSSTDACDEWRFDGVTGDMISAYWGVPSVDASWHDWRHVLEVPLVGQGTVRLLDRRPFLLPQAMIGAFDARGRALVCMMGGTRPGDVDARIEIAPDLFLFLSGGRHRGWALLDPTDKGCLRGEELLPLPLDELARARESLAQALAGIFALSSDDEAAPVRLRGAALARRLEELGASLARRASPVASRVLMHAIEHRLIGTFITPENAAGPWVVAEARRRKTGQIFRASHRDARGLRRAELHPPLRERADVEERIVRLHRRLRWPDPQIADGRQVDSKLLRDWVRARPATIAEWMAAADIPAHVTGLSTLDQFARVNDAIAEQERRSHPRPLDLLDWTRMLDGIGAHAEVRVVHDALSASPGRRRARARSGQRAPQNRRVDAVADLVGLTLTVTERSLEDESGDRPVGRCVHCRFITHGVEPDRALQRTEASAAAPPDD